MTETSSRGQEDEQDHASDWETVSEEDETTDFSLLPVQETCSGEISGWHHNVITAIENRSLGALEELIDHPLANRGAIIDHAEDIIEAVGKAVSSRTLSPDFRSTLEMLMFVVVEYGSPSELIMFFSNIFHKSIHVDGAEVEFFIPNMQGTLLRLQRFRLFWLSSILAQIDYYVGDMDWSKTDENGETPKQFDWIVHMHTLVCDFVQPFVDDVKTSRVPATIPKEKNSPERAVSKYRECLARSLLHLLAEPLGSMPVSYAKGFLTYQRIVALLGSLIPDFTVFITWLERDQLDGEKSELVYEENTDELMKSAIGSDSIAKLAFLVRCCNVEPDNFPAPLSATFFLTSIVLPLSDYHGVHQLTQHLHLMTTMLNDMLDGSLAADGVSLSLVTRVISDLLGQAYGNSNAKFRKRIYTAVQLFFTKLELDTLHLVVRNLWHKDEIKNLPTVLEVLVVALKKPVVDQLRSWPDKRFERHQFLDIFKTLLRTRVFESVSDCSGLVASVLGLLTMVIGMDRDNRTGITDLLDAVEEYHHYWSNILVDNTRQIKEELWLKTQNDSVPEPVGNLLGLDSGATKEQTAEFADQHLNWTNILTLNLDSLQRQIELARNRNSHK